VVVVIYNVIASVRSREQPPAVRAFQGRNAKGRFENEKYFAVLLLTFSAFIAQSCADPAANKPKATVSEASPESTSANLPALRRWSSRPKTQN
jgi:hypothetical protein